MSSPAPPELKRSTLLPEAAHDSMRAGTSPMSKPLDERIAAKISLALYHALPTLGFVFGIKLLNVYMNWPFAVGLAALFAFGLIGYSIPARPKQNLPRHLLTVVVLSLVAFTLAYLATWLGWTRER